MQALSQDERDLLAVLYVPLRRFASAVRPPDVEADDLLHDALARVLARSSLSEVHEPLAYLRRVILNVAANHRRRWATWARLRDRLVPTEVGTTDAYPSDVADLLRLPPRARAVLYLRVVEGRSYAEIADLLGCSEVAARKTASRARRTLAIALADDGGVA